MAEWRRGLPGRVSGWSFTPPQHSRPPPHLGFWRADVQFWEKQFFIYECPVTWAQLRYAKQFMSLLHKKIQEWDDQAGLEAFQNAKFRYWAKINNCQCDLPLPDPDMYIDEIDYKTVVDAEVVADLNVEPQQPAPVESSFLFMNEPIRATRWATTEVPLPTSGLAAQHLSANSDALLTVNRSQPTGRDVAENNSSWDVKLESSYAWNSARWDRNDAYGSKWNTGDGSQDAYGKNS